MPQDAEDTSFEVAGNRLRVCGELGPDDEKEEAFAKASQGLMETEHETLVIDLTAVRYMGSSYVRHIAPVMVWAKQHGRSVTVRATKRVARLLSIAGLDRLGDVEVVD